MRNDSRQRLLSMCVLGGGLTVVLLAALGGARAVAQPSLGTEDVIAGLTLRVLRSPDGHLEAQLIDEEGQVVSVPVSDQARRLNWRTAWSLDSNGSAPATVQDLAVGVDVTTTLTILTDRRARQPGL